MKYCRTVCNGLLVPSVVTLVAVNKELLQDSEPWSQGSCTKSRSPVYSEFSEARLSSQNPALEHQLLLPLSIVTTSLMFISSSRHCCRSLVICLFKVYSYWTCAQSGLHQIWYCTSLGPWQYTCQTLSWSNQRVFDTCKPHSYRWDVHHCCLEPTTGSHKFGLKVQVRMRFSYKGWGKGMDYHPGQSR